MRVLAGAVDVGQCQTDRGQSVHAGIRTQVELAGDLGCRVRRQGVGRHPFAHRQVSGFAVTGAARGSEDDPLTPARRLASRMLIVPRTFVRASGRGRRPICGRRPARRDERWPPGPRWLTMSASADEVDAVLDERESIRAPRSGPGWLSDLRRGHRYRRPGGRRREGGRQGSSR